jgi:uncharacterized protein (TIGR02391 family)
MGRNFNNIRYIFSEIEIIVSHLSGNNNFTNAENQKFIDLKIQLDHVLSTYGVTYHSFHCKNLYEFIGAYPLVIQTGTSYYRTTAFEIINSTRIIVNLIENQDAFWFWSTIDQGIQTQNKVLFHNGHYKEVVKNLGSFVDDQVKIIFKKETGIDVAGKQLMERSFSFEWDNRNKKIIKYPIIALNFLQNQSERDEQEGFKNLFIGFISGIRNVYAHTEHICVSRENCIEKIVFANMLMTKLNSHISANNVRIEEILSQFPQIIAKYFKAIRDFILYNTARSLKSFTRETVSKSYIAYSIANKNYCEIKLQKNSIKVYLDIPVTSIVLNTLPIEDVSGKGRSGTGKLLVVFNLKHANLEFILNYIQQSHDFIYQLHI